MFDLQKVGRGHVLQLSLLRHCIVTVKIHECFLPIFVLAIITVSEIKQYIFNLQNVVQGHVMQFSMANDKIYKHHFLHFLFSLRYDLRLRL